MPDSALNVEVRVGSDGAVKGFKIASSAATDAAELIRSSLATLGKESTHAKEKHEGLVSTMREFKKEATQNSRVARFFANDLAAIVPGASGAAGALRSLIGIGLGGASLFSGIELGVFALEHVTERFHEMAEEQKKAKEEFAKWTAELEAGSKKVVESVAAEMMAINGASKAEMAAHKDLTPLLDERLQWKEKLATAEHALAAAEGETAADEFAEIARAKAIADATMARADAIAHLAQLSHAFVARAEPISHLGDAEDKEHARKAEEEHDLLLTELEKSEKEFSAHILQMRTALARGEEKIELENAAKIEEINAKYGAGTVSAHAAIAVQSQLYVKQTNDFREAEEKKITDRIIDLEAKAAEKIRHLRHEQDQQRAEFAVKLSESAKKELDEEIAVAKGIGQAFGATFAGIADGTMNAAGAFKTLAKAVIEAAVKSVEAYAASAAAAAYFAEAGIPVVGPILGAAAAATAGAFVLALVGNIPSAAGGYDIPAGLNPVVQTHAREMILPAHLADGFRNMIDGGGGPGGGGGGGGPHVHIHAMDGVSVQRVVESPAFARAIHEARRNGLVE